MSKKLLKGKHSLTSTIDMVQKQEDNIGQVNVFHAISDSTRRELLNLVAKGEQPVKTLAQAFAMSRPAISQHLRILKQAGLVVERRVGREHLYGLQAEPLHEVSNWVQHYEYFWRRRLDIVVHAPFRKAHSPKVAVYENPVLGRVRYLIDTFIGQLTDQCALKRVRARDLWHLRNRLLQAFLMHTVCFWLNQQAGTPCLQFDQLVA